MAFPNIEAYNKSLVKGKTTLSLNDYFKNVYSMFYTYMNEPFLDYYLSTCGKENEFIVHHKKLIEYGIFSKESNKNSNIIFKSFAQYNLQENKDYNVVILSKDANKPSKKVYTLTPKAFKKCLVRAKNTTKYYDYYMILNEMHNGFTQYEQSMIKQKNKELLDETNKQKEEIHNLKELVSKAKMYELKILCNSLSKSIDTMQTLLN